jgi:predicted enzyme related to lactoylglutathione lyase
VYFELVEWKSADAAERAHGIQAVQAVWGSFEGVAKLRAPGDLPESFLRTPFAKIEAMRLGAAPATGMGYSDNMLSARDISALSAFYRDSFGLLVESENQGYIMLVDPVSRQRLCLTKGESVARMSPGICAENLEEALGRLEKGGARVRKRWEYPKMLGANCEDPEGNEILVWQELV